MTSPTQPQPPSPSPRALITTGIISNSIPEVRHGIGILTGSRKGSDPAWALARALEHAQPDIVRYLLDEAGATVDGLGPFTVAAAAVDGEAETAQQERAWEVLVERGWDVNAPEGSG